MRRLGIPRFPLLLLALVSAAVTTVLAAPADRAPVTDPPEENPLPIGMTPDEEAMRHLIGTFHRDTPPPPGPVRQCAEWEPVTGVLVRYPFGLPYNLLREAAEEIELWVLVANSSEQNTCYNALNNQGVDMDNVRFILAPTNSMWTRDYGPQFAFDIYGDMAIIDHHYNRPRPLDDVVNYECGDVWDIPVYGSPLIHTGGNFMGNGHGVGFSTDLVYDENPGLTDAQVDGYMNSYLGLTTYEVVPDISLGGIHHIDVWAKLLDERTILVKQLPNGHADYNRTEQNVAYLRTLTNAYGEPYNIVRIYCPYYSGSQVAAYTNAIILNNKVLVPTFGISQDAQALDTIREAMPGYEVFGFSGSWLSDDAIHCRMMGIHDKYMLRVDMAPLPDTLDGRSDILIEALIDDHSEAGLKPDSLLVYWREQGDLLFEPITMAAAAGPDSFYAYIPVQSPGTTIEYYIFAADESGRRETRPPVAPAGWYATYLAADPAGVEEPTAPGDAGFGLTRVWPNPLAEGASVNFRLPSAGPVAVTVWDVHGRKTATVFRGGLEAGGHTVRWNGRDDSGREVAAGLYFVRLEAGAAVDARRVVKVD